MADIYKQDVIDQFRLAASRPLAEAASIIASFGTIRTPIAGDVLILSTPQVGSIYAQVRIVVVDTAVRKEIQGSDVGALLNEDEKSISYDAWVVHGMYAEGFIKGGKFVGTDLDSAPKWLKDTDERPAALLFPDPSTNSVVGEGVGAVSSRPSAEIVENLSDFERRRNSLVAAGDKALVNVRHSSRDNAVHVTYDEFNSVAAQVEDMSSNAIQEIIKKYPRLTGTPHFQIVTQIIDLIGKIKEQSRSHRLNEYLDADNHVASKLNEFSKYYSEDIRNATSDILHEKSAKRRTPEIFDEVSNPQSFSEKGQEALLEHWRTTNFARYKDVLSLVTNEEEYNKLVDNKLTKTRMKVLGKRAIESRSVISVPITLADIAFIRRLPDIHPEEESYRSVFVLQLKSMGDKTGDMDEVLSDFEVASGVPRQLTGRETAGPGNARSTAATMEAQREGQFETRQTQRAFTARDKRLREGSSGKAPIMTVEMQISQVFKLEGHLGGRMAVIGRGYVAEFDKSYSIINGIKRTETGITVGIPVQQYDLARRDLTVLLDGKEYSLAEAGQLIAEHLGSWRAELDGLLKLSHDSRTKKQSARIEQLEKLLPYESKPEILRPTKDLHIKSRFLPGVPSTYGDRDVLYSVDSAVLTMAAGLQRIDVRDLPPEMGTKVPSKMMSKRGRNDEEVQVTRPEEAFLGKTYIETLEEMLKDLKLLKKPSIFAIEEDLRRLERRYQSASSPGEKEFLKGRIKELKSILEDATLEKVKGKGKLSGYSNYLPEVGDYEEQLAAISISRGESVKQLQAFVKHIEDKFYHGTKIDPRTLVTYGSRLFQQMRGETSQAIRNYDAGKPLGTSPLELAEHIKDAEKDKLGIHNMTAGITQESSPVAFRGVKVPEKGKLATRLGFANSLDIVLDMFSELQKGSPRVQQILSKALDENDSIRGLFESLARSSVNTHELFGRSPQQVAADDNNTSYDTLEVIEEGGEEVSTFDRKPEYGTIEKNMDIERRQTVVDILHIARDRAVENYRYAEEMRVYSETIGRGKYAIRPEPPARTALSNPMRGVQEAAVQNLHINNKLDLIAEILGRGQRLKLEKSKILALGASIEDRSATQADTIERRLKYQDTLEKHLRRLKKIGQNANAIIDVTIESDRLRLQTYQNKVFKINEVAAYLKTAGIEAISTGDTGVILNLKASSVEALIDASEAKNKDHAIFLSEELKSKPASEVEKSGSIARIKEYQDIIDKNTKITKYLKDILTADLRQPSKEIVLGLSLSETNVLFNALVYRGMDHEYDIRAMKNRQSLLQEIKEESPSAFESYTAPGNVVNADVVNSQLRLRSIKKRMKQIDSRVLENLDSLSKAEAKKVSTEKSIASLSRLIGSEPANRLRRLYGVQVNPDNSLSIVTTDDIEKALAEHTPIHYFGSQPEDVERVFANRTPQEILDIGASVGLRSGSSARSQDESVFDVPSDKTPQARLTAVDKLLEMSPNSSVLLHEKGILQAKMGLIDEAHATLSEALKGQGAEHSRIGEDLETLDDIQWQRRRPEKNLDLKTSARARRLSKGKPAPVIIRNKGVLAAVETEVPIEDAEVMSVPFHELLGMRLASAIVDESTGDVLKDSDTFVSERDIRRIQATNDERGGKLFHEDKEFLVVKPKVKIVESAFTLSNKLTPYTFNYQGGPPEDQTVSGLDRLWYDNVFTPYMETRPKTGGSRTTDDILDTYAPSAKDLGLFEDTEKWAKDNNVTGNPMYSRIVQDMAKELSQTGVIGKMIQRGVTVLSTKFAPARTAEERVMEDRLSGIVDSQPLHRTERAVMQERPGPEEAKPRVETAEQAETRARQAAVAAVENVNIDPLRASFVSNPESFDMFAGQVVALGGVFKTDEQKLADVSGGLLKEWNGRIRPFGPEKTVVIDMPLATVVESLGDNPEKSRRESSLRQIVTSESESTGSIFEITGIDPTTGRKFSRTLSYNRKTAPEGKPDKGNLLFDAHERAIKLLQDKNQNVVFLDTETDRYTRQLFSAGILKVDAQGKEMFDQENYTRGFYDRQKESYLERKKINPATLPKQTDEEFEKANIGFTMERSGIKRGEYTYAEYQDGKMNYAKSIGVSRKEVGSMSDVEFEKKHRGFQFASKNIQTEEDQLINYASRLKELTSDGNTIVAAHNAAFDIGILADNARVLAEMHKDTNLGKQLLIAAEYFEDILPKKLIDTAHVFQLSFPERTNTTLQGVAQDLHILEPGEQTHTSRADNRVTAAVFREAMAVPIPSELDTKEKKELGVILFTDEARSEAILVHKILPIEDSVGRDKVQILGMRVSEKQIRSGRIPRLKKGMTDKTAVLVKELNTGFQLSQRLQQGRIESIPVDEARGRADEIVGIQLGGVRDRARRIVLDAISPGEFSRPDWYELSILRGRIAKSYGELTGTGEVLAKNQRSYISRVITAATLRTGSPNGLEFAGVTEAQTSAITDAQVKHLKRFMSDDLDGTIQDPFFRKAVILAGEVLEKRSEAVDRPFIDKITPMRLNGSITGDGYKTLRGNYTELTRRDDLAPLPYTIADSARKVSSRTVTLHTLRRDGKFVNTQLDFTHMDADVVLTQLQKHARSISPEWDKTGPTAAQRSETMRRMNTAVRAAAPQLRNTPKLSDLEGLSQAIIDRAEDLPDFGYRSNILTQDVLTVPEVSSDYEVRITRAAKAFGGKTNFAANLSSITSAMKRRKESRSRVSQNLQADFSGNQAPEMPTVEIADTNASSSGGGAPFDDPSIPDSRRSIPLRDSASFSDGMRDAFTRLVNIPFSREDAKTAVIVAGGISAIGLSILSIQQAGRNSQKEAGAGDSDQDPLTPDRVNRAADRDLQDGQASDEASEGYRKLKVTIRGTHLGLKGISLSEDALSAISQDISATLQKHLGAELDPDGSIYGQSSQNAPTRPWVINSIMGRILGRR